MLCVKKQQKKHKKAKGVKKQVTQRISYNNNGENRVVIDNLVYLTEHLTDIEAVLIHLVQNNIISKNEKEEISLPHKTGLMKSTSLWELLDKKDWNLIGNVCLEILRMTGNNHCARRLDRLQAEGARAGIALFPEKWWPEQKTLISSHYQQRHSSNLPLIEKLQEILQEIRDEDAAVISQIVAVSGVGGVGKTTTTIWYATHYEDHYDHIVWIDCHKSCLKNSFTRLADSLDIKVDSTKPIAKIARKCFRKLSVCKCLIVFDNAGAFTGPRLIPFSPAPGENGIQQLIPSNDKGTFHTIITSRSTEWGKGTGQGEIPIFMLDPFHENDGVNFLKKRLKLAVLPEEFLFRLTRLLGSLPMCLNIAVAIINQGNYTIAQYIDLLEERDTKMNAGENNSDSCGRIVENTILISVNALKENVRVGELSEKILRLIAYIFPDQIPFNFLVGVLNSKRKDEIVEAVDLLEYHCLVTTKKELFFSVPRIVQEVMMQNNIVTGNEVSILKTIFVCESYLQLRAPAIDYINSRPHLIKLINPGNTISCCF